MLCHCFRYLLFGLQLLRTGTCMHSLCTPINTHAHVFIIFIHAHTYTYHVCIRLFTQINTRNFHTLSCTAFSWCTHTKKQIRLHSHSCNTLTLTFALMHMYARIQTYALTFALMHSLYVRTQHTYTYTFALITCMHSIYARTQTCVHLHTHSCTCMHAYKHVYSH